MGDFGREKGLQLDFYKNNNNNNNMNNNKDLRSYSVNDQQFTTSSSYEFEHQLKRAKTTSFIASKVWCFNDPEFKRKKRVASYRAFTAEGKVKGSFRKSFRWIKERFLSGWW